MKKMSKLVMAAILAVALQGTAMAAAGVNLDSSPTGASKYANELITVGTSTLDTVNGTTQFDVSSQLGFGVSTGQTRYIRFDLTGLQFSTTLTGGTNETDGSLQGLNCTSVISSGGIPGASNVIFQITANQNLPQNGTLTLDLTQLRVTNKSQDASVKYSLYEQAAQAQQGGDSGLLYSKTGTIAQFGPGFDFTATTNTSTAAVTELYKKFTGAVKTAKIGSVTYGVVSGVLNRMSGGVAMTDLIQPTSKLKVTTDQNLSTASMIYLNSNGTCNTDATPTGNVNAAIPMGTNTAELTVDTNTYTNAAICYVANGTLPIAVQNFTISADITPNATALTQDVNNVALGNFIHDGTVLRAPFIQGQGGQSSFVQLANMGTLAADYTVTCYGPTGTATAGTPSTVAAGQTKKIYMNNTGCAANTNALEFIMNVPNGNVVGSFIRQNTTTGDTGADSLTGNAIN